MKSISRWKKPLLFGIYGALGCWLGALLGEGWLWATRPAPTIAPPHQTQNVALVLDTSGSMQGDKLNEVKNAAKTFLSQHNAPQNEFESDRTAIIGFDSSARVAAPLGAPNSQLMTSVDSLESSGQTRIDLGLQSALSQLQSAPAPRSILLFTDGQPDDFGVDASTLALQAAQEVRAQNVRLIAIATGDADADYLAQLTGDRNLVFWADSGNFGTAFQRASEAIYGRQLSDSQAVENSDPNAALWRIGVWTSLLGAGLALALLWGQAHTLGRPLEPKIVLLGVGGALIVGGVAGALGQIVFAAAPNDGQMWETLSRVLAWALLGGVMARGMSAFVPNLQARRAWQFGGLGGALAAGMFVQLAIGSDILARSGGAITLGFCIGLMVVLAEMVGRRAWLDVRGSGEIAYQLNLGAMPLRVGSERARCEIWVPESAPQIGNFALQNDQVFWHDEITKRQEWLQDGAQKQFANLQVTVRQRQSEIAPQVLAGEIAPQVLAGEIAPQVLAGNSAPQVLAGNSAPQVLAAPTPPIPTDANPFDQQSFAPPQAPQVLAGAWQLRGLQGAPNRALDNATLSIGRAPDNAWPLQDNAISSQHAVLQWHEGHWWLRDLGSTNGSWLNGARLNPHEAVLLNLGDVVRLGSQEWRVEA